MTLPAGDRAILDFERRQWKYAGAKEAAIKAELGVTAIRYYQRLSVLLDDPAAVAYDAALCSRLRRQRVVRLRARNPQRVGL